MSTAYDHNEPTHDEADPALDALLRTHLARELDGQLGRSRRAFEAHVAATAASPSPETLPPGPIPIGRWQAARRHAWAAGLVGAAMAASLAAIWVVPAFVPTSQTVLVDPVSPDRGTTGTTMLVSAQPTTTATFMTTQPVADAARGEWEQVESVVRSMTQDAGIVLVEDETPVRMVRQVAMERTEWVDERRGVRMEAVVPRENVRLIPMDTY